MSKVTRMKKYCMQRWHSYKKWVNLTENQQSRSTAKVKKHSRTKRNWNASLIIPTMIIFRIMKLQLVLAWVNSLIMETYRKSFVGHSYKWKSALSSQILNFHNSYVLYMLWRVIESYIKIIDASIISKRVISHIYVHKVY